MSRQGVASHAREKGSVNQSRPRSPDSRNIEIRAAQDGSERLLSAMCKVIDRHAFLTRTDWWTAAVEVQNCVGVGS